MKVALKRKPHADLLCVRLLFLPAPPRSGVEEDELEHVPDQATGPTERDASPSPQAFEGGLEGGGQGGVAAEDGGPSELDALALALGDEAQAVGGEGEGVDGALHLQLALQLAFQLRGHGVTPSWSRR